MIPFEEFRSRVGFAAGSDSRVESLRSMVIALWEAETGLLWNKRTAHVEVVHNWRKARTIFLQLTPVTSITKVEERTSSVSDDWEEITTTGYWMLLSSRKVRYLRSTVWPEFVRFTYDGGSDDVSGDIKESLVAQAKFLRNRLGDDKIVVRSQNFEGGSGVLERADLHPMFREMVRLHGVKW